MEAGEVVVLEDIDYLGSASGCYSPTTSPPRGTPTVVALPVTATGYPIVVGAGGTSR